MKIGVDLDDVLLDCTASLTRFHNTHYGTSHERKDIQSWDLAGIWGCTEQEVFLRINKWYGSSYHSETPVVLGAQDAIAELSKLHELYIISSRPKFMKEPTERWIAKHFPDQFSGLYLTSDLEAGTGPKAETCRVLEVSFLIEDAPMHARDVADNGTTVLLLDCPWNQGVTSNNIFRFLHWGEILDFLSIQKTPASS